MTDNTLTRRQALRRLGLSSAALYLTPALITLSTAAHASSVSEPSEPSVATPPTPPTPPSEPSNPSRPSASTGERDEQPADNCRRPNAGSAKAAPAISQEDQARALASVEAGYSKPLSQIWQGIMDQYPGQVISITFTGHRFRPRYRLRAVSPTGRLETVIVSARTGRIERIVGC